MMALEGIEIQSRILCQDIRQEKSDKLILIGVYPGDIVSAKFPTQINLAFYIEVRLARKGLYALHFRIRKDERELGVLSIEMDAPADDRPGVIPSPPMQVQFDAPGVFAVDVSLDETTWLPLISKKVELGKVEGGIIPNVSLPPSEQSPSDDQEAASPPAPSRRKRRKKA